MADLAMRYYLMADKMGEESWPEFNKSNPGLLTKEKYKEICAKAYLCAVKEIRGLLKTVQKPTRPIEAAEYLAYK